MSIRKKKKLRFLFFSKRESIRTNRPTKPKSVALIFDENDKKIRRGLYARIRFFLEGDATKHFELKNQGFSVKSGRHSGFLQERQSSEEVWAIQ